MNTTPTEQLGIVELFLDWKKKCSENAKMKNFLQNLVNGKTENVTQKMAKNILEVLQEQAKEVLKEVEK